MNGRFPFLISMITPFSLSPIIHGDTSSTVGLKSAFICLHDNIYKNKLLSNNCLLALNSQVTTSILKGLYFEILKINETIL